MTSNMARKRQALHRGETLPPKKTLGPWQEDESDDDPNSIFYDKGAESTLEFGAAEEDEELPALKKPRLLGADPKIPFKLTAPVDLSNKAALDAKITDLERKEKHLLGRKDRYQPNGVPSKYLESLRSTLAKLKTTQEARDHGLFALPNAEEGSTSPQTVPVLPLHQLGGSTAVALPQNWEEELKQFPPHRTYEPSYVDLAKPDRVKMEIAILKTKIHDLQGRKEYSNSEYLKGHMEWYQALCNIRALFSKGYGEPDGSRIPGAKEMRPALKFILETKSRQTLEKWKAAAEVEVEKARAWEDDLSLRNAEQSISEKQFNAQYHEAEGMKLMWKNIGSLIDRRLGELEKPKKK